MDAAELSRALEGRLDGLVSPRRAAHTRGVAAFSESLCRVHGLDPRKGRAAGLAHDLCKEMPRGRQAELAARFAESPGGFSLSSGFLEKEILHGPAAAGLLVADYGIEDTEILEAVARHTLGDPRMGILAILVYAADKIEPGREHVSEAFRSLCLELSPRALLRAVLEDSLAYLRRKERAIAPETILLYNSLLSEDAGS